MFDKAPNNLPTEPEDILAEADASSSPAAVPSGAAANAPMPGANVDSSAAPATALEAGRLHPSARAQEALPSASMEDMQSDSDVEISPPILNKRNIFIIAVVALVVLIGAGAFWVWRSSVRRAQTSAPSVATPSGEAVQPANELQVESSGTTLPVTDANTPAAATTTAPAAATVELPSPAVDADSDGLTDQQEIQYGTDPQKSDTDADTLTDYEEIFIWHTNPLNPDTDGDTYQDGMEVKNGYNPNGSGKLLTIPAPPQNNVPAANQ